MNYEILLATSNEHKLKEVRAILAKEGCVIYGLNDLNIKPEDVVENGKNYYENALIKAKALQKYTSLPIIADDSGIEIEAMGNKPGLHTARYAKEHGGHLKTNQYIVELLKNEENRKARFICDIVLLNVEDKPLLFEGIAEGEIAKEIKGEEGFGYDPIFYYPPLDKNFAELSEEEKNQVSHRARALKKLLTYLKINRLITKPVGHHHDH